LQKPVFNSRLLALGVCISIAGLFLIVKLASLHFSSKISLAPVPDRHEYVRRGFVRDSLGNILAMSLECRSLYVNPEEINSPPEIGKQSALPPAEIAKKISAALALDENEVLKRVMMKNKRFVWIKRKLSESELSRAADLDLRGVHYKKEYIRAYPYGGLASHILGFVNADNLGVEGIEYKYDDILTSYNNETFSPDKGDFRCGNSVNLTIDRNIQEITERSIEEGVRETGAREGTAIVLEVKTGRILSLAKYPGYDPNAYSRSTAAERSFFGVTEPYEPGSTMKIFSAAAYLSANPALANEVNYCKGGVDISDAHINCTGTHGAVRLADSITYSCNVGIISLMKHLSSAKWYSYIRAYGFGERTGSEIAGESPGILREVKKWSGLSKYSTSIGQELSVTVLQLAAGFSAIANGGVYNQPHIVDSVTDAEGNEIIRRDRKPKGRIMSPQVAAELRKMLARVVREGTGKKAAVSYFVSAGKTGTAQKSVRGSYTKDVNISSFAGFAPYENPEICIVAVLDEPKGNTAGSVVAAPIFASIADKVLPYRGTVLSKPSAHQIRKAQTKDAVWNGGMPDFRGKSLAEAAKIIASIESRIPIHVTVEGNGKVAAQIPAPGTALAPNAAITLTLSGRNE
jgi:cell division protein FtsI/penicillin-binding protein 2